MGRGTTTTVGLRPPVLTLTGGLCLCLAALAFAAVMIGLIDTLGRSYLDDLFKTVMSAEAAETSAPAISAMLIYIIMALVLAVRPQGLFPPKVR
mgnify:CR=1 FL=1